MSTLLNVGSGGSREVPACFSNWAQKTLDIDARANPDVIADARELRRQPPATYDAVYCSHCLEHFYKHEVGGVLAGFAHVLRPKGFVHLAVPDMSALFAAVASRDIDDVWYVSQGGPITFHDVIYGWQAQVSRGNEYYAHKTGFTAVSLSQQLTRAGFTHVLTATDNGNLYAYGFKSKPTARQLRELDLCP